MKYIRRSLAAYLLILGLGVFPLTLFAQALTVIGGDFWANSCFENAEYAATNMPIVNKALVKPCDSAIEYGTLSLADRAATYANRGIILAATENIDSAMADYNKAMTIRPEAAEIYVNRGNAYFLEKDYVMAMDDYEQSVALGIRQLHFVRYNMGMTFEKLGRDSDAETQFRIALELSPGWELVEQRLGRLLERQEIYSR